MNPPDALLLDMDGLLLDSERVARECYLQACAQMAVDPLPMSSYVTLIGRDAAEGRRLLAELCGEAFPVTAFDHCWTKIYTERTTTAAVPLRPAVRDLLTVADDRDIICAVVTSTATASAERTLAMAGIREAFAHVVGGDQVSHGKPAPDIYRLAVDRLGVPPGRCWAVEDSTNGVRAALAAGLRTVQVPDLVPVDDEVAGLGQMIVDSLADVATLLAGPGDQVIGPGR